MFDELKKRNQAVIKFFYDVLIPLWETGREYVDYYEYIQSPAWREKSRAAQQRAGNRCQICNRSSRETQLNTHHRTYEHLGHERPGDLTVLCRDCHELYEFHKRMK